MQCVPTSACHCHVRGQEVVSDKLLPVAGEQGICNSTLALDDMDIIKSHEFLVQVNKMDLAVLYF